MRTGEHRALVARTRGPQNRSSYSDLRNMPEKVSGCIATHFARGIFITSGRTTKGTISQPEPRTSNLIQVSDDFVRMN